MGLFAIIALAVKFLMNPAVMGVLFITIAALTGLWFLGGPALFWKVLRDARLWLLVAVAAVVFGYAHLQAKLDKTEQRLEQVEQQKQAHDDGQEVVKNNIKKQVKRAQQGAKYQEVIHNAPTGEKLDALLDEFARDQGVPDPRPSAAQPVPDGVSKSPGRILP
ncbi:membrane protein [Caulobacter phage CcrRogue]|uniref:Putative inner membrane spanin component n=1 Tax=Caulobacter phage CcrRogue TaxID=2927986 RepID=K4JMZ9_9CAUD|nr:membrane protein [Caulobacter phage CcrRogue]AFU86584.1 putative inner membrane spanin component [Caulobacter phage CcrRogue]